MKLMVVMYALIVVIGLAIIYLPRYIYTLKDDKGKRKLEILLLVLDIIEMLLAAGMLAMRIIDKSGNYIVWSLISILMALHMTLQIAVVKNH